MITRNISLFLLLLLPTSPLEVAASFSSTIPMVMAASGEYLSRNPYIQSHSIYCPRRNGCNHSKSHADQISKIIGHRHRSCSNLPNVYAKTLTTVSYKSIQSTRPTQNVQWLEGEKKNNSQQTKSFLYNTNDSKFSIHATGSHYNLLGNHNTCVFVQCGRRGSLPAQREPSDDQAFISG